MQARLPALTASRPAAAMTSSRPPSTHWYLAAQPTPPQQGPPCWAGGCKHPLWGKPPLRDGGLLPGVSGLGSRM